MFTLKSLSLAALMAVASMGASAQSMTDTIPSDASFTYGSTPEVDYMSFDVSSAPVTFYVYNSPGTPNQTGSFFLGASCTGDCSDFSYTSVNGYGFSNTIGLATSAIGTYLADFRLTYADAIGDNKSNPSFVDAYVSGSNAPVVAAVPEPGTYALMIAGLGVLGMISRRRKAA